MKTNSKTLLNLVAATAFAAFTLAASPAFASEEIDAALKDKVTKQMTEQGYDVRKVQMEDGMIEVYAVKEGKTFELYLDKDLKIVKTNGDGEDGEGSEGNEG